MVVVAVQPLYEQTWTWPGHFLIHPRPVPSEQLTSDTSPHLFYGKWSCHTASAKVRSELVEKYRHLMSV